MKSQKINISFLMIIMRPIIFFTLLLAYFTVGTQVSFAANNFSNGAVADAAESSANGAWGGQCKEFANAAVEKASSGTVKLTGYQQGYANAGGVEVSSSNALRGDIIQITPTGSTDSTVESMYNSGRTALHTAIITTNNGGNNFTVIDSNWGNNSLVQRHAFNPYTWAAGKPYGGTVKIWRMGNASVTTMASVTPQITSYQNSDFDGDGISDLAIFQNGVWNVRSGEANNRAIALGLNMGSQNKIPLVGDFSGDGQADFITYRDGIWNVILGKGPYYAITSEFSFGNISCSPLVGDLDGNGIDDYIIDCGGVWSARSGSSPYGYMTQGLSFGSSTDIPVVADFDGDGKDDFATYTPSTGAWNVLRGQSPYSAATLNLIIGGPGCTPLAGKFNGDSKNDFAVNCNGVWTVRSGDSATNYAYLTQGLQFGSTSSRPLTGHFTPNGWNDFAISAGGQWAARSGVNPYSYKFQGYMFGGSGDTFITG